MAELAQLGSRRHPGDHRATDKRLSKTSWPSLGVCNFQLSWSEAPNFQNKFIKLGPSLQITKIPKEPTKWCPRSLWDTGLSLNIGLGLLAVKGFKVTAAKEEGCKIFVGVRAEGRRGARGHGSSPPTGPTDRTPRCGGQA